MREQMRVAVTAATVVVCLTVPVWAQQQVVTVQVIQPRVRNIVWVVTRPSVIESYERASIQSKLTAFIEKWNVDIGDKVKKGEVLASLFAPELVEDLATTQAMVGLAKQRVELARELVSGAETDLAVANARVNEARLILAKYQAEVDRWSAEVAWLQREVDRGVVDPKVLAESRAQWKSSTAALDAAKATIATTEAETRPKQAAVKKAALDNRRHATGDRTWRPINGSEQVILGDRSHLADGVAVTVAMVTSEADVANAMGETHSTKPSSMSMAAAGRTDHHGAAVGAGAGQVGGRGINDATSALDRLRVELAIEKVKVAEAGVAAAEARCTETRLILTQREVAIERWDHEVKRLKREVDRAVVDPGILTESTNMLKLSTAARDAAKGTIATAAAEFQVMKAKRAKAQVEVRLAEAAAALGRSQTGQQTQANRSHDEGHEPHQTAR